MAAMGNYYVCLAETLSKYFPLKVKLQMMYNFV